MRISFLLLNISCFFKIEHLFFEKMEMDEIKEDFVVEKIKKIKNVDYYVIYLHETEGLALLKKTKEIKIGLHKLIRPCEELPLGV